MGGGVAAGGGAGHASASGAGPGGRHAGRDRSLDAILHAIAHPIRRAIIERLSSGPAAVAELAEPHEVSLPAISQHLRVLERAGLLEQTRVGRVRRCELQAAPLSTAFSWLVRYRVFWENVLDDIQATVEREPWPEADPAEHHDPPKEDEQHER